MSTTAVQLPAAIEKSREELIDEFAELDRQYQQVKPAIERRKFLREWINGLVAAAPADQPVLLHGNLYELQLSSRRQEYNWTSKLKVWRAIGGLKAVALWEVTFKAVKEAIGEGPAKALQTKTQTGYRTITPILKSAAIEKQAA